MVGLSMSCVIRTAGAHVDILESIQGHFAFWVCSKFSFWLIFCFCFLGGKLIGGGGVSLEFGVVLGFSYCVRCLKEVSSWSISLLLEESPKLFNW